MRRTLLLLASMMLAVLLACGMAYALTVNCVEGEAFCVGTNNDDTLNGSEVAEHIYGLLGNDQMFGNGGDDELTGGKGKDTMKGGEGADSTDWSKGDGTDMTYGEGGNDNLNDSSYRCPRKKRYCVDDLNLLDGGDGNDYVNGQNKLYGGPGADYLSTSAFKRTRTTLDGGPGLDVITGSVSQDTVYAQDGERDEIDCDANTDTVYYDAGIDVVNPVTCENRITDPPPQ